MSASTPATAPVLTQSQIERQILDLTNKAAQLACASLTPFKGMDAVHEVRQLILQEAPHLSESYDYIFMAIIECAAGNHRRMVKPERPNQRETTVYFARRRDGCIKIGSASNVEERLKQLSAAAGEALQLIGTMAGGVTHERALHRQFKAHRAHREWFNPSAELWAYINANTTGGAK